MSINLDQGIAKLNRLATAIETLPHRNAVAVASVFQASVDAQVKSVAGGGVLRNAGRRSGGARIGTKQVPIGTNSILLATYGPFHLIENNTKDHNIPAKLTATRRRRKRGGTTSSGRVLLAINGSVVTGPVHHPGTTGKHPFAIGIAAGEEAGALEFANTVNQTIASIMTGR